MVAKVSTEASGADPDTIELDSSRLSGEHPPPHPM